MNLKFRNPHEDHFPHCVVDQLLSSKLDENNAIVDISPMCLSFNKQGSLLAVGYNEGSVLLWDYSTHNVIDRFFNTTTDKQEEKKESIKKEENKEILEKQTIPNVNQENYSKQTREEETKKNAAVNNNSNEKEDKQVQVNEEGSEIINLQNKEKQQEMEIETKTEIKKEKEKEKEKENQKGIEKANQPKSQIEKEKVNETKTENEKPIERTKPKGRGRGRGKGKGRARGKGIGKRKQGSKAKKKQHVLTICWSCDGRKIIFGTIENIVKIIDIVEHKIIKQFTFQSSIISLETNNNWCDLCLVNTLNEDPYLINISNSNQKEKLPKNQKEIEIEKEIKIETETETETETDKEIKKEIEIEIEKEKEKDQGKEIEDQKEMEIELIGKGKINSKDPNLSKNNYYFQGKRENLNIISIVSNENKLESLSNIKLDHTEYVINSDIPNQDFLIKTRLAKKQKWLGVLRRPKVIKSKLYMKRRRVSCFSKDGESIFVTGASSPSLIEFDTDTLEILGIFPIKLNARKKKQCFYDIKLAPNGKFVVLAAVDNFIRNFRIIGEKRFWGGDSNGKATTKQKKQKTTTLNENAPRFRVASIFGERVNRTIMFKAVYTNTSEYLLSASGRINEHKLFIVQADDGFLAHPAIEDPQGGDLSDIAVHPTDPVVITCSNNSGVILVWDKNYADESSVFNPWFTKLLQNRIYIEREDEFDHFIDGEPVKKGLTLTEYSSEKIDLISLEKDFVLPNNPFPKIVLRKEDSPNIKNNIAKRTKSLKEIEDEINKSLEIQKKMQEIWEKKSVYVNEREEKRRAKILEWNRKKRIYPNNNFDDITIPMVHLFLRISPKKRKKNKSNQNNIHQQNHSSNNSVSFPSSSSSSSSSNNKLHRQKSKTNQKGGSNRSLARNQKNYLAQRFQENFQLQSILTKISSNYN
ncbi:retinoblastoma-binding protein [Anaeramoeba flamelloides]|uniref:Retinoblastoma-binding protein n=1 Tax=Anaeramoeba flamelloides TaxID=1746091 RepID=A0ABQ8Y4E3_9EUKA|nr:retinoblastoma-binding protein [Anaeramoeba flamelloides]